MLCPTQSTAASLEIFLPLKCVLMCSGVSFFVCFRKDQACCHTHTKMMYGFITEEKASFTLRIKLLF